MIQIKYNNWWAFKKKEQSIRNTLSQLDLYNKTDYLSNKNIDSALLEEASSFAHEKQLVYYVTIFQEETPYCFLEINKGFFRVCFLDEFLRKYMSYDFTDNFKEINSKKLFLNSMTFWEFKTSTDKINKITNYIFKPDGQFTIVEKNLLTNEQITNNAKGKIDISANWEDYPEFGNYKSLIKKERGLNSLSV